MQPITLFLSLLFFSCSDPERNPESTFSYDLAAPERLYRMPKPLKEISGISFVSENTMACVEDNHGIVYLYDLKKEKLSGNISFDEKGDYEDIVKTGENFYVLRSDGMIFRLSGQETKSYQTGLSSENNTEGLCLDRKNNNLLIACKDDPGKQTHKNNKSVYEFSLANPGIPARLAFSISADDIALPDSKDFSPSGIAIHPQSGNIFIISSRGNILLETDKTGKILHAEKLYGKFFTQPEGICFSPQGDLFISNEGREHEQGTILRFKQK
jgi:uncharacterized protein YjiK